MAWLGAMSHASAWTCLLFALTARPEKYHAHANAWDMAPGQSGPNELEVVPQDVQNVPQGLVSAPEELESVPQELENVPQELRNVPQGLESVPQHSGSVPQELENAPQELRNDHFPEGIERFDRSIAGSAAAIVVL